MAILFLLCITGIVFILANLYWYFYFKKREKSLLDRLQNMVDQAADGSLDRTEISETKFSRLEDSMKKYLENSRLSVASIKGQKEIIQGLISDIAHQTLTPVSNLKLYTQLLIEKYSMGPDTGQEDADIIDTLGEQAEKLDFLIQSLVKLSRLENGIIHVNPQRSELSGLISGVAEEYNGKAGEKDITLEWEDTGLLACFDMKWMREALGNIVDNALKYTPEGGRVNISAAASSFFVKVDVADNGIGIDEEEIPQIFSRFYRGTSAGEESGVGIGLYLAREIVSACKGYIKVYSKRGEGSIFSVYLPVTPGNGNLSKL